MHVPGVSPDGPEQIPNMDGHLRAAVGFGVQDPSRAKANDLVQGDVLC